MDNKQFPQEEDFFPEEIFPVPDEQLPEALSLEEVSPIAEEFSPEEILPSEDTPGQALLTAPELGQEITADEHAMAWHGMTHPTEPEEPFDMGILEDPELAEPVAETYVPEECSVEEAPEEAIEEAPVYAESLPEELPVPTQELFRDEAFHEAFGDGEEFDQIFNAPVEEPPIPTHERPARKGRPKPRKGEILFGLPQLVVTLVWLAIILISGVTLGRMLWVCAADVLAFGREDKAVTITIYEADTIDDIAEKLHKAELVRYPGLFKLYASFAVDEGDIDPGIWDLNTRYDYHALVNMMSASSSRKVVEALLIPEGYTCRQIFELLEENKVCTAVDIAAYAANGELDDYWFLEGVQRGSENCLEGFLFPDTYDFYENSSPREVLEKMLDNFNHRFAEEMKAQLDSLNANVTGGTFDIHDVIIVASMIEKETANNEESPMIASVIYNRLFNWGSTPPYLNIDASIIYALDGKTDLTSEDMRVDSPYNTYLHVGLTPGPIANPGLASIKAALNPETTKYYYYVLNPATGKHQFSSTLEEHESYVDQYRSE